MTQPPKNVRLIEGVVQVSEEGAVLRVSRTKLTSAGLALVTSKLQHAIPAENERRVPLDSDFSGTVPA